MNTILQQPHAQYWDDSFLEKEGEEIILEEQVVQCLSTTEHACFIDLFSSLQPVNIVHQQEKNKHECNQNEPGLRSNVTLPTSQILSIDTLNSLAYQREYKPNQLTSTPLSVTEKAVDKDPALPHWFFSSELKNREVQNERVDVATSKIVEFRRIDFNIPAVNEKMDPIVLTTQKDTFGFDVQHNGAIKDSKTIPIINEPLTFSQRIMSFVGSSASLTHINDALSLKLSDSGKSQIESAPITTSHDIFVKESRPQLEVTALNRVLLKNAIPEIIIREKQVPLFEGRIRDRVEHESHSVKQDSFIQQATPVMMTVDLQQQLGDELTEPLIPLNNMTIQPSRVHGVTSEMAVLSSFKNEVSFIQPSLAQEKIANLEKGDIFTPRAHLQHLSSALYELQQQHVNINVEHKTQYATLRLDPPSLGKIEIKMVLQEGRLNITLYSQNADVQHAIKNSTNYLLQQLEDPSIHDINIAVSGQRFFSDKGSGEEHGSKSFQQTLFKKDDQGREEQHQQKALRSAYKNNDDSILVRV